MPWKPVKVATFNPPSHQDLLIIEASVIIGVIVIVFFALQSFGFRAGIDLAVYHFSHFRSLF